MDEIGEDRIIGERLSCEDIVCRGDGESDGVVCASVERVWLEDITCRSAGNMFVKGHAEGKRVSIVARVLLLK